MIEGKIVRGAEARHFRNGEILYEGTINSLKRFKDDAKEVQAGYECGIGVEGYDDMQEKDTIEAYIYVEVAR